MPSKPTLNEVVHGPSKKPKKVSKKKSKKN